MTPSPAQSCGTRRWPLERVLFAIAGSVTITSAALAATVSSWFLLLTAFVGVNQWLFVLVGNCPMSLILRRVAGLRGAGEPDAVPAAAPTPKEALAR